MPTMITYICQHCGGTYQRRKGDPQGKFCSQRCVTLERKPSQHLIIPDGQPMSPMTQYRRRKAAGLVKPKVSEPFNEKFFDAWSDESAWLLGLIWSDGCLFGNTIEICSKDLQMLELAMALIDGGTYNLKNRGSHIRVYFTSKHLADRLRSIGLTEHKSLTIRWPDIDATYSAGFIRGLIDGDGSVLTAQTRTNQQVADLRVQLVTASTNLRDGVQAWFEQHAIRYAVNVRTYPNNPRWHPLWKFMVTEQASLRKLHGLLYPHEDVVCLHRKRVPFDVWIDTPRGKVGRPFKP